MPIKALDRKKLTTPIERTLKHRSEVLATVRFYNRYPFPSLSTEEEQKQWWQIVRALTAKIDQRNWRIRSKEQRESGVVLVHGQVFPEYVSSIVTKKFKAPDQTEVLQELKKIQLACYQQVPVKGLLINILPRVTIDNKAVNGDCLRMHPKMNLYIDGNKGWKRSLAGCYSHEYMHLAYPYPEQVTQKTLTDWSVREGLADHFAAYVSGRKKPNYPLFTYKQGKSLLRKNKYWLNRELSQNAIRKLYYDNEGIVHQLGYLMVGLFLDSLKTLSWASIMAIPPEEIMQISHWAMEKKLRE